MAHALDEAKRQRELTKESLSRNLDRFETRVRAELDWKSRLRRDGPRYAVMGGVVIAGVVGVVVLRKIVGDKRDDTTEHVHVASLEDLIAELSELRATVEKGAKTKDSAPLWQKLVLKGATAAAAAGAAAAMRQMTERYAPSKDAEPKDAV